MGRTLQDEVSFCFIVKLLGNQDLELMNDV